MVDSHPVRFFNALLGSEVELVVDSLQGKFLVASPMLGDSNFFRTVVLVLQHDNEGAMGLVLTRPTETTVRKVMEQLLDENNPVVAPVDLGTGVAEQPVQIGGPVPGPLIAIHDLPDCSESEVLPGLYIATQRATMNRLLASDARIRLFSGYSGWGEGQLEEELKVGGWLIGEADAEAVLGDPEQIWENAVRRIGQDILNIENENLLPDDPSMN